jgi:hypothetical protein
LLDLDAEVSLKETKLAEWRRNEECEQKKRGGYLRRKGKEQADYPKSKHITNRHRNGTTLDLTKVVCKVTSLDTFRLNGLVPLSWPEDQPFHLAPQRYLHVSLRDCLQVDEVLSSFVTARLTTIDLFYTQLSMDSLIVLPSEHQNTLPTLVLQCSMVLDGQWSDVILHICRVRTLKLLRISALYIGSSDVPNSAKRVSDLKLDGYEAVVAEWKPLV